MGLVKIFIGICVLLLVACSEARSDPRESREAPIPDTEIVADDQSLSLPPAKDGERDERTRVVMLGDSLTAGFGLPIDQALPNILQRKLGADRVEIINAGVSGDTSGGALARYDWSVASQSPDILVVALGANDFLGGVDPGLARENLEKIVERALGDDLIVLLVGLSPRGEAGTDLRAAEYAAIYPDLAATYELTLVPAMLEGVRDRPDLLQQDGLHPTADGTEVVADTIAPVLATLLPSEEL